MPPDPRCTKCGSPIPRLVGSALPLIDLEVPILCSDCFLRGLNEQGLTIYNHYRACDVSPVIDRMSRITNIPEG